MTILKKNKIIVACHDAGGAEVVSAYVKSKGKENFICYVHGPAIKIFKRRGIRIFNISKNSLIGRLFSNETKYLITGTSRTSSLELDFIKAAKKAGVKSICYLDHWVNYLGRFYYPKKNWRNNLPDEFWVGDEYAFDVAVKLFKNAKIKLVPNRYFLEVKKIFVQYKKSHKQSKKKIVLLVSEPLTIDKTLAVEEKATVSEYILFDKILSVIKSSNLKVKVIIRNHPSENVNKYIKLVKKYHNSLDITISKNSDLMADITRSTILVGFKSMALIIGKLCGKKVVSFFPDEKSKLPLPFRDILKIKKADELMPLLK
jgi:hypothetical protein